jgi:hypothetical protein
MSTSVSIIHFRYRRGWWKASLAHLALYNALAPPQCARLRQRSQKQLSLFRTIA